MSDPRGYWRDCDAAVKRTTLLDRFAARVAQAFESAASAVEKRLDHNIDRHLELAAIPRPRKAISPDRLTLTPLHSVEKIGTYPCCDCCLAYTPQPCPVVHRTPCDKDECGMDWAGPGGVA